MGQQAALKRGDNAGRHLAGAPRDKADGAHGTVWTGKRNDPAATDSKPLRGKVSAGKAKRQNNAKSRPALVGILDSAEPPRPLWGGVSDEAIDRQVHAAMARMTSGLSPASLLAAYGDWARHLAISPGKQARLVQKAVRKAVRLWLHTCHCAADPEVGPCIEPLAQDKRFGAPEWQTWPFNLMY